MLPTPHTARIFGAREFALMQPSALFLNTARGSLWTRRHWALMNGLNLCAANVVAFLQGQVRNRVV